jgi:hypothetical protein
VGASRIVVVPIVTLLSLILPTPAARAQSATTGTIAGEVKDATGGVLPGVTVEASSPALIEKVRTVVTDGQGQYRIIELRPGTYTVTFSLPGFSTVRREQIELTTGFTAVLDAALRVGAVEETVTVSGASPIVDTQNVRTQNVLSHEVLDALPTGKALSGLSSLTLGTSGAVPDVGGNRGEAFTSVSYHGGRTNDQKIKFDGMGMNSMHATGGGANRIMLLNQVSIQEMVLETSGISAESETGGVQINAVPREGGNQFRVYFVGAYTNDALQTTNITPELEAAGVTTAPSVKQIWDWGVGLGGPIKKDRLWFYTAHRWWGAQEILPGAYWNATQHTPFYTPDLNRPAFFNNYLQDHGVRLTWQAAKKHKIAFSENAQRSCHCSASQSATVAPEATSEFRYGGYDDKHHGFHHLTQTSWTYPATSRLLFDAGASFGTFLQPNAPVPGVDYETDVNITDVGRNISYGAIMATAYSPNYSLDSEGRQRSSRSYNHNQRFSASYVTGSHAFKVGMTTLFGIHDVYRSLTKPNVSYVFRNQVPISLSQFTSPGILRSRLRDLGIYAQDQWTLRRLTFNLGARFDRFNANTLEQNLPPTRFVGARHWPAVENVPNWRDVTPRLGVAYDLFGDGKTAVKVSLGRYLIGLGVNIVEPNHPANKEVSGVTRTWNDSFFPVGDARRGNYVPDCDLHSPSANDECGAMSNPLFGTQAPTTSWDPATLNGWDSRDYNWQGAISIQHELRPGIGLNGGYFRRWYGNFRVTDNLAVTPQDHDEFCIAVPSDSRLPNAGQPLCGLYDVRPALFGRVNNFVTKVEHFGKQTEVYDGFEVSINARIGEGRFSGGMATGRTEFDSCAVVDFPQIFCNYQLPWRGQTQVKLNGSYPLPWDLQASAVFQNLPGIPVTASYVATNAEILPTLGRNLAQCGANPICNGTVTLNNLFEPNTVFADRLNQLDLRLTKIIAIGRTRVQGMFDMYNAFNANTVLALNNRYSVTGINPWQRPTSILGARLLKFGMQFDF